MTKEDKQLLLADLCARLPYGVKIKLGDYDYQVCGYNSEKEIPVKIWFYYDSNLTLKSHIDVYLTDYCPYLRPISSMTEDEKKEYYNLCETCVGYDGKYSQIKIFDWLNKNMFDYRDLISKGLAIKASEGIYEEE